MFRIEYSPNLSGSITVSWSKNAALPLIAANELVHGSVMLTNMPNIVDTNNLQTIANEARTISKDFYDLTSELCSKIRASILLIPVGIHHFGMTKFFGVGWCKIGKRSLDTFDDALDQCGIELTYQDNVKVYQKKRHPQPHIILKEFSVTTTEAVLTYLAFYPDSQDNITLYQAAIEPHVINLIDYLTMLWAQIQINYDHSITITPQSIKPQSDTFKITGDYLEAWLYLGIGAVAPNSELTISWFDVKDLLAVLVTCRNIGINYTIVDHQTIKVNSHNLANYKATKIHTMIYPWFPTDLQSIFGAIMTQCNGKSTIFETLFEWRFSYLAELENLGAKCEILNTHEAVINWPVMLKGNYLASTDIRWWWAALIASIIAQWTSHITNELMILRWYDDIVGKLQSIGVRISKIDNPS